MTDITYETMSPQKARAELRESFLRAVRELKGEPCQILTYEQSTLGATFNGWKPDGSEIIVNDLKTPANIVLSSAVLRTPDVLSIHFDKDINQS